MHIYVNNIFSTLLYTEHQVYLSSTRIRLNTKIHFGTALNSHTTLNQYNHQKQKECKIHSNTTKHNGKWPHSYTATIHRQITSGQQYHTLICSSNSWSNTYQLSSVGPCCFKSADFVLSFSLSFPADLLVFSWFFWLLLFSVFSLWLMSDFSWLDDVCTSRLLLRSVEAFESCLAVLCDVVLLDVVLPCKTTTTTWIITIMMINLCFLSVYI